MCLKRLLKRSCIFQNALQTARKQQERSIIKRMTRILSSDGGLNGTFLKLGHILMTKTVVAYFVGQQIK